MGGDTKLSETHASYFPPSLQPPMMGVYPPIKSGQNSQFDRGNLNYFQDYRINYISKFQMPKDDWGVVRSPYSPKPDLVAASKMANINTMSEGQGYALTYDDPGRKECINMFYEVVQRKREQYKDYTGQLHPLRYFKKREPLYQCAPEMTDVYMSYPQHYLQYTRPPVLPLTLNRTLNIPPLPNRTLAGRYYKESCITNF